MKLVFKDSVPNTSGVPRQTDYEDTLKKFKGLYCPRRIKRTNYMKNGWRLYGAEYKQDAIDYEIARRKGSWL